MPRGALPQAFLGRLGQSTNDETGHVSRTYCRKKVPMQVKRQNCVRKLPESELPMVRVQEDFGLLLDGCPEEGPGEFGEPVDGGGAGTPEPPLGGVGVVAVEVGRTPPLLIGSPLFGDGNGLLWSLIPCHPHGKVRQSGSHLAGE